MSRDLLEQKKLAAFVEKVYALAEKTFDKDEDGDLPVNVLVVDRTRYYPHHWFDIPYDHKAHTTEEKDEIVRLCMINVRMATEALERAFKLRELDKSHPKNDHYATMKERVEALEAEVEERREHESKALRDRHPLRNGIREALDLAVRFSSSAVHHECLAGDQSCTDQDCVEFRSKWKKLRDVYGKNMPARALEAALGRERVRVPD